MCLDISQEGNLNAYFSFDGGKHDHRNENEIVKEECKENHAAKYMIFDSDAEYEENLTNVYQDFSESSF